MLLRISDLCGKEEQVLIMIIWNLVDFQTVKAMAIGKKGRVHVEDIVFLIRKDPKKYARVKVSWFTFSHTV